MVSLSLFYSDVRKKDNRSPLNRARLAPKPVRNIDLVLLVSITEGEDISTLDSLVKVAKDVVDDDNGLGSIDGAGDI